MKNLWKNLNVFQIVSIILIVILFVAIIVQIGIIVNLKNQIDDTNNKNDEIVSQLPEKDDAEANFNFKILISK